MKLTIATLNIQNKYYLKNYDGREKSNDHTDDLVKYLYHNDIDILGIQELTRRYQKRLLSKLSKYHIVGKFRLRILGHLFPLTKYDEANSIISKYEISQTKTIQLSLLGTPRILTKAVIKTKNRQIGIFNTHLEVSKKNLKRKQLSKILTEIRKMNIETILMGDFNCTVDDPLFSSFIEQLSNMNYKRIPVDEQTHKVRNKAIDHIFIPKNWNVDQIEVVKPKNNMSDHKSIIVNLSFK